MFLFQHRQLKQREEAKKEIEIKKQIEQKRLGTQEFKNICLNLYKENNEILFYRSKNGWWSIEKEFLWTNFDVLTELQVNLLFTFSIKGYYKNNKYLEVDDVRTILPTSLYNILNLRI